MAIINGPFASKTRGRAGEVVFAKTTGNRTAMRSYQPKVKNPKTLRQRVSRTKLAMASVLAAALSEAVKIGYAKAANGTKMYARNMFVKDIVSNGSEVFSVSGESVTVNSGAVLVSKKSGISIVPVTNQQQASGSAAVEITATNQSSVVLPAGSKLGLVVVLTSRDLGKSFVHCGSADSAITLPEAEINEMAEPAYFAFYKEIPESFNGVADTAIPWKYPSLTGESTTLTMIN